MKTAFRFVSITAAALALTFTLGCAPPAPPEVDTSTEMAEPSSNTTASAEMPMTEEPAAE